MLHIEHDDAYLKNRSEQSVKLHRDKAQPIVEEHTKLIEQTREYHVKATRLQKEILEKLEDFFKNNNLEFKQV